MNICTHLVKDQEIIGIGPLMFERTHDQTALMIYKTTRYFFELHLKAHTIVIKSNWADFAGHDPDKLADYKVNFDKFKLEYIEARKAVAEQIGETNLTDLFVPHIDKVSDAYETIKDQLTNLLSDLVPADHCQDPINHRVSQIYESIRSLRDLACSPVL